MRIGMLALTGLVLTACSGGVQESVITGETPALGADRVMYRTVFNVTSNGVRSAQQRSDSLYMFEDSSTAQLFGVNLVMYDSLGHRSADVRSLRGRLNTATQEMSAHGNVVVVLADGTRIESEELHYDPSTHRIWSDVETKRIWPDGGITLFSTFRTDDKFSFFDGTNMRGRVPGLTF